MKKMILLLGILTMSFTSLPAPSFIDPNTFANDSGCDQESHLRSKEGVKATEFTLTNHTKTTIVLYWLNYEGKRVKYEDNPSGQRVSQPTFLTHPWVATDTKGRCIRILTPPGDFVIE
jgi:von Hippel-Lindau disease tumor supressor